MCMFTERTQVLLSPIQLAKAKRIAAQDPHHVRGIRTMEVLEWSVRRAFRLDRTVDDVERLAKG